MNNEHIKRTALPTRRSWRFSIQRMLVVVTLLCVCVGVVVSPALRHRAHKAKLAKYQAKWRELRIGVNTRASCDDEVTEIYVWGSQLTTLPPKIGNLKNLERLHIERRLTKLPPEIGKLKNLKELWLADTQLIALPPEIGQFTKLEHLSITDSQLDVVTIRSQGQRGLK